MPQRELNPKRLVDAYARVISQCARCNFSLCSKSANPGFGLAEYVSVEVLGTALVSFRP